MLRMEDFNSMSREEMIEDIIATIQEVDNVMLSNVYWFLKMELDG